MEDFNINDIVSITSEPNCWSSQCNTNNIKSIVKYPFIGRITKMAIKNGLESIELGGGGWCLSTLKGYGLIKKISRSEISNYLKSRPYTVSELLDLFERLYPVGTKYKSVTSGYNYVRKNELQIVGYCVIEKEKGTLYDENYDNELAKIIKSTTDTEDLGINLKTNINTIKEYEQTEAEGINLRRIIGTIGEAASPRGEGIFGKASRTTIESGHISYGEISGY